MAPNEMCAQPGRQYIRINYKSQLGYKKCENEILYKYGTPKT